MKRFLFILLGSFIVMACALTPMEYGPLMQKDVLGIPSKTGYMDRSLGDKCYEIQVRGKSNTMQSLLNSYFHRRAEELCGSQNYETIIDNKSHVADVRPILPGGMMMGQGTEVPYVSGEVQCK